MARSMRVCLCTLACTPLLGFGLFISALVAMEARTQMVPGVRTPYAEGVEQARADHAAHAAYWGGSEFANFIVAGIPIVVLVIGSLLACALSKASHETIALVVWVAACVPSLWGLALDRTAFQPYFKMNAKEMGYRSAFALACFENCSNNTGCMKVSGWLVQGAAGKRQVESNLETFPLGELALQDDAMIAYLTIWALFILHFVVSVYCWRLSKGFGAQTVPRHRWTMVRMEPPQDHPALLAFEQSTLPNLTYRQSRLYWKHGMKVTSSEHPEWFCPITKELLRVPVKVTFPNNGGSISSVYEYKAIKRWWQAQRNGRRAQTDPVTNLIIRAPPAVNTRGNAGNEAGNTARSVSIDETVEDSNPNPIRSGDANISEAADVVIAVDTALQGAILQHLQGLEDAHNAELRARHARPRSRPQSSEERRGEGSGGEDAPFIADLERRAGGMDQDSP